jgi:hypothetical protein
MQTLASAIKDSQSTFGNRQSEIKIAGNKILASAIAYKNRAIDHSKNNGRMGYGVRIGIMVMIITATFGRWKVN